MADLSKVVKLTQEQYNTLVSGGTVGDYTGLDPTFLYLVEDMGDIIDVSNGVTAEIRDYLIAHPATLLKYGEYIYVAQYTDGTLGSDAPTYYNCFEGDDGSFHYLVIDWENLTIESETTRFLKTTETAYDSTRLGGHTVDYFIDTSSTAQTKSGNLTLNGVTDVSGGTLKLRTINAPTASGGTTYGPGTSGQVLKSNGTTVYWATDTNNNQTIRVGLTVFGANAAVGLVAGTNVDSIVADTTNNTITINTHDTTYTAATTSAAGLMSATDKVKLDGIATGAEVNVQSDWSVTDTSSDAFIKNKPTIPTSFDLTDDILDGSANKYAPYASSAKAAGRLYVGTTNPTNTTRLNYDGYFYATKLYSGGNEVLTGHQSIKTLKTDNTAAQTASSSEAIAGSGTINLHKVSKTGSYDDLNNKPSIPVVTNYYWADVQVSASSNKGTTPTVSKITIGGSGSTAGKATMQYNATEDCIDFVFA